MERKRSDIRLRRLRDDPLRFLAIEKHVIEKLMQKTAFSLSFSFCRVLCISLIFAIAVTMLRCPFKRPSASFSPFLFLSPSRSVAFRSVFPQLPHPLVAGFCVLIFRVSHRRKWYWLKESRYGVNANWRQRFSHCSSNTLQRTKSAALTLDFRNRKSTDHKSIFSNRPQPHVDFNYY